MGGFGGPLTLRLFPSLGINAPSQLSCLLWASPMKYPTDVKKFYTRWLIERKGKGRIGSTNIPVRLIRHPPTRFPLLSRCLLPSIRPRCSASLRFDVSIPASVDIIGPYPLLFIFKGTIFRVDEYELVLSFAYFLYCPYVSSSLF